jgi:tRNA (guanine37-N1)-methyltransferase
MIEVHIGTIFPEFFESPLKVGNLRRAIEKELLKVVLHNLRDYTSDPHRKLDDRPYGGGSGMVMKPEPFFNLAFSLANSKSLEKVRQELEIILLTPRGVLFNQEHAILLSRIKRKMLFLCGRYEGIDERVAEHLATMQISIGDYVLSGGETAVLTVLDAIVRLIPGVVGDFESVEEESFQQSLLEYPQYTRPEDYLGFKVPKVLLSGNHRLIKAWRLERQIRDTKERRPDLFEKFISKPENKELVKKFLRKKNNF